jgi:hypothetical protein
MLKDIQTDLNSWLHLGSKLTINGKEYIERICVNYKLGETEVNELLPMEIEANNMLDNIERNDILNYFHGFNFDGDLNTRQAVFQPKYKEDPTKAACIASIQVLLRKEVYVNVNMRSSNYERNWLFDQQTFALVMKRMCDRYKLPKGVIFVTIGSLHKEISK